MTEAVTLHDLHKEIVSIAQRLHFIEENVEEIHEDLHHVRPEYLEK